jgi:NAD(P)-dependent dehydrogenase (short-subunit alcohol dehydrogenase family)
MSRPNQGKKIALVTGSSSGIGKATAIRLGADQYHVYVTYCSNKRGGKETLNIIHDNGGSASLCHLDVSSESSVLRLINQINRDYGRLDVVVSNGARDIPKNIENTSFADWSTVMGIKLHGSFLITKYSIPLLKKGENPNIIIITSYEGEKPNPDYLAYGIATAGLIAFAKAMSVYLPKYGIRVNAISPGEIRSNMWKGIGLEDDQLWNNFAKQNPMKRVTTPEDVADTVMMLINDPHRYINGNLLYVDGGNHLR